MRPSYAVLFKTHFWDAFSQRQLDRLKAQLKNGDIYVLIDETFDSASSVPHDNTIRIKRSDIAALALAPVTTHGSIIWYNIDYPHYVAFSKLPRYDYYIAIEYDVSANLDLDALVQSLSEKEIDYLGFPIRKPAHEWPWYNMHTNIYGAEMLVYLSCISGFSHRALAHLLSRRQEMGRDFAAGRLRFWPNNEAFIPNEIRLAGMRIETISQFGETEHYDWWPPTEESDLADLSGQAFVHPVLNGTRYARSLIYHEPSLTNFFRPRSVMRRKLEKLDPAMVRPLLRSDIKRRLRGRVLNSLEALGLRRKWYTGALSGSAKREQQKSAHNSN